MIFCFRGPSRPRWLPAYMERIVRLGYEGAMKAVIPVRAVASRKLAPVRRRVSIGKVGTAWRPALDLVWQFLRSQPELRTDGHSIG